MLSVYLSGGMDPIWRSKVKEQVPDCVYSDPCSHGLANPAAYVPWNRLAIARCDVLFGYLSSANNSGIGLALAVGYAKAMGKTVILVVEEDDRPHYGQVKEHADVLFSDLNAAIDYLHSLSCID